MHVFRGQSSPRLPCGCRRCSIAIAEGRPVHVCVFMNYKPRHAQLPTCTTKPINPTAVSNLRRTPSSPGDAIQPDAINGGMIVKEVPLLDDNYGYLLVDEATKDAAAIDAVEPPKVLKEAEALGVNISMVLTTHKHWDHASGNSGMAKHLPGIPIVGGAIDNVEACTRRVNDGEHFMLGDSVKVTCVHTPGHTLGHICYVADDRQDRAVFTGDTLFIGGAGKFFEGTPADMYHSLYDKLAKLPGDTKVYCGHEYTLSNYKFALSMDKTNAELARAAEEAQALRAQGRPTVPSTIDKELATNPFMRVDQQAIKAAVPGSESMSPAEILGAVREMKDRFR